MDYLTLAVGLSLNLGSHLCPLPLKTITVFPLLWASHSNRWLLVLWKIFFLDTPSAPKVELTFFITSLLSH